MKIVAKAIFGGIGIWILMFILLAFLAMLFNNLFDIIRAFSDNDAIYPTVFTVFISLTRFLAFVFTGFMTARMAKRNELLHGFFIGLLVWAIMAIFITITNNLSGGINSQINYSFWILSTISLFIGCLLGAYIQKRLKEKRESKDSIENKIDQLGERLD